MTKAVLKPKVDSLSLYDPRQGELAFKLEPLSAGTDFSQPQRFNYFTILWLQSGHGAFHADLSQHEFHSPVLLFFIPYQTFFLKPQSPVTGFSLQFHANFFCIEAQHEAVGCNGVLFNDVYGVPRVQLDESHTAELGQLIHQIQAELSTHGLAHAELLTSYLKVFLIKATRLKLAQQQLTTPTPADKKPNLLDALIPLIETHYRSKRSPREYAALLHISEKALNKLVKTHLHKTLTELIRERILKHAKWQLLHTRKSVKEIAYEVGFADEFYFSRLFKRATGCSPALFRDFETTIRNGSNLSM